MKKATGEGTGTKKPWEKGEKWTPERNWGHPLGMPAELAGPGSDEEDAPKRRSRRNRTRAKGER